jgi:hypothetical protein
MRSVTNLFRAVANLAGSVNALANLLDAFTGRLRQQLALDEAAPPTVLEHQGAGGAGGDNAALGGNSSDGTGKRKSRASAV